MTSLAVFDFDRTIVDEDSDATIIDLLREKQPPPEWEQSNHDWTPYMDEIFQHAHSAGLSKEDMMCAIGRMRPTPGVCELISALAEREWHVLVITDSNSVFVHHWLKAHELEDKVMQVITNRAYFDATGRLRIEPYTHQETCARCPANLCKQQALASWRARHRYVRVAYAGDGRNDFCPMCGLGPEDIVFPRAGYACERLVAAAGDSVRARALPWTHAAQILRELLPEYAQRIALDDVLIGG